MLAASPTDVTGWKTTSRFTVVFSFSPFSAKVASSFCIFSSLATRRLLAVPNEAESTAKSVYVSTLRIWTLAGQSSLRVPCSFTHFFTLAP